MMALDQLCYRSKLRHVHPGEKAAFTGVALLLCVSSHSVAVSGAVLLAASVLTVWKGGIPARYYGAFLGVPLTFLALSGVTVVLQLRQTPLDFVVLSLRGWYLTGHLSSVWYALRLTLTALAAVSCLLFLSLNTPMPELVGLLRKVRCPELLLELLLLTYRSLFLLLDTAAALSDAQKCRLSNRNIRTAWGAFGRLGTTLLVRGIHRSRHLYDAMEARCYEGRFRVLSEHQPLNPRVLAAVVLFGLSLLGLALWERGMR